MEFARIGNGYNRLLSIYGCTSNSKFHEYVLEHLQLEGAMNDQIKSFNVEINLDYWWESSPLMLPSKWITGNIIVPSKRQCNDPCWWRIIDKKTLNLHSITNVLPILIDKKLSSLLSIAFSSGMDVKCRMCVKRHTFESKYSPSVIVRTIAENDIVMVWV